MRRKRRGDDDTPIVSRTGQPWPVEFVSTLLGQAPAGYKARGVSGRWPGLLLRSKLPVWGLAAGRVPSVAATYTSAVRAAAEAASKKSSKRDPEQTRAIREWANGNGYEVSARGRIPTAVVEAFDAVH